MPDPSLRTPPTGISRLMFRAPIALYRWHLGWMMGGRFLLLNHVGRVSGKPRRAVVEVVSHDPGTNCYVIASSFGEASQWFRNLMAAPDTTIQVGTHAMRVHAERLPVEQALAAMLDYAGRHPGAARKLSGYMGFPHDGSAETYRKVGEVLPFIRLCPR